MSFISALPNVSSIYSGIQTAVTVSVTIVTPVVTKVIEIGFRYFEAARQTCFCVIGVDEFYLKGVLKQKKLQEESKNLDTDITVQQVFERIINQLKLAEKSVIRGTLFLASGIFGIISAMHELRKIEVGNAFYIFNHLANGFFLAANIIGLDLNIQQFKQAQHALETAEDPEQKIAAWRACDSAILGMMSSLGYILVGAISLIGASATLTLMIGCIAAFTGFLKILYDWKHLAPLHKQ